MNPVLVGTLFFMALFTLLFWLKSVNYKERLDRCLDEYKELEEETTPPRMEGPQVNTFHELDMTNVIAACIKCNMLPDRLYGDFSDAKITYSRISGRYRLFVCAKRGMTNNQDYKNFDEERRQTGEKTD